MPKHEDKSEALVLVATAPNEPIARMWAGILENEGIHSLIQHHGMRSAQYASPLFSQCKIYVLASQAEKAKEILAPSLNIDFTEASQAPDTEEQEDG
ncbi:MAG: DUF2007 domain-containing protein [Dehalococcoidales bacterium]|nr:DUF2007 domain-containing protein [Dehalococcoidales bacterium]